MIFTGFLAKAQAPLHPKGTGLEPGRHEHEDEHRSQGHKLMIPHSSSMVLLPLALVLSDRDYLVPGEKKGHHPA